MVVSPALPWPRVKVPNMLGEGLNGEELMPMTVIEFAALIVKLPPAPFPLLVAAHQH